MPDINELESNLEQLNEVPNESGLDQITSHETESGDIEVEGDGFFIEGFSTEILEDKDMVKFIKQTEKLIRKSTEYSNYIAFLHTDLNISKCSVLGHIDSDMASIEMHHYPFTLYDITHIVVNHFSANQLPLTTFDVADHVMSIHYENMVGLVPLSVTMHELAHSGDVFINLTQVFGDLKGFIDEYKTSMSAELQTKFLELVKRSQDNEPAFKANNNALTNEFTAPSSEETLDVSVIETVKADKAREVVDQSVLTNSVVDSVLDNL